MKLKSSFRNTLLGCSLVLIGFASCSEGNRTTEATDQAAQEHKQADEAAALGQVVVETPDYTTVAAPVKDQLSRVLEAYLEVKDALVDADPTTTQDRARSLLTAVEMVNLEQLPEEERSFAQERLAVVRQRGTQIAEAAQLEGQRENLEPLSEAVFALTKAFGASGQTVYYQHCPMARNNAGAYWVSVESDIRNPYFGQSMLKCGSNEEVLN